MKITAKFDRLWAVFYIIQQQQVELWAKFINAEETEEFNMIAEKDPYIKSAYDQLQIISQDEQKRLEYEAREKAILDYNQGMPEAKYLLNLERN